MAINDSLADEYRPSVAFESPEDVLQDALDLIKKYDNDRLLAFMNVGHANGIDLSVLILLVTILKS